MRLRFLEAAKTELGEARDRYEGVRKGLGRDFVFEVSKVGKRIAAAPYSSQIADDIPELRRAVVERFPYAIFYQVLANEVRIVAVVHTSRRAGYWHRRAR